MKKILVFSNMDQIGDGIIKLPFLHKIKNRFPEHHFIWVTHAGNSVFNSSIKNIANQYIDEIYEKVPLASFIFRRVSSEYNLNNKFDIILDTQKAVLRSLALKRLNSNIFISSSLNWMLSDKKPKINKAKESNYYLNDLFLMLDLISHNENDKKFELKFPSNLEKKINGIFDKNLQYFGFAPGSATKERIWDIDNFINVAKHFEKLNYVPTFFLGPLEKNLKEKILNNLPNAIFPEDLITEFSGPEVVMACSKNLFCSLANDSGTSHMLSVGSKSLVKIVGPTGKKFTIKKNNFYIINSNMFGGNNVNLINSDYVIDFIEKKLRIP